MTVNDEQMTECFEPTEPIASSVDASVGSSVDASVGSSVDASVGSSVDASVGDSAPDPILSEVASLRAELSELRRELELRRQADEINRRNASLSAGPAGRGVAPEYYTPDEVRAMSPQEVRENYQRIRASMKKW